MIPNLAQGISGCRTRGQGLHIGLQRIPLGFTPAGMPQEAVPAVQVILLPLLSALLFIMGWLGGLFFYRRPDQRILALAVWSSSALSALLFLFAVFFLITTPI